MAPRRGQRRSAEAPKQCIETGKSYSAVVTKNFGAFTIELAADASPGTVNNFVTLARYHYYDETGCHRVIKEFVDKTMGPPQWSDLGMFLQTLMLLARRAHAAR